MWRYLAGGAAVAGMGGAAFLLMGGAAASGPVLPPPPAMAVEDGEAPEVRAARLPEATPKTREEKRFGRYDKDRNGGITRDEYLLSRRKAYARLDRDGDGRLSFDEWSAKTQAKFAGADRDKSGAMDAAEFATTAVKRRAPARARPCPPEQREEG